MRWVRRLQQRWREQRHWAAAHTLEDLGELTARRLVGRIAYQPGYYGPVDVDEDVASGMRDTLIRLNRAGFVTEVSQAGWDGNDDGQHSPFQQWAAVEGFASPAAAARLRQVGDEYQVITEADAPRGGVPVSHCDGKPYTRFGRPISRRGIAGRYPGVHGDAINALDAAEQITIYDPQIGRNTLWAALDEAVHQPE